MLNNKVIIVTGGSGLLGSKMITDIRSKGGTAINFDIGVSTDVQSCSVQCDITSDKSIFEAIELVRSSFGRIDGLVNNAYPRTKDWGISFELMTPESWRKNVDWQLNSYFVVTQQVLKLMKAQRSGSIVNIASIYGVVGNDFTLYEDTSINTAPAYSAIKGGLINFTRYLASLYGMHGVRVNCVSPGGIFADQDPKFVRAYERKVPLKRMGNADDVAPPVSFLLSEEARYITGHNLMVDGGWTAI